MKKGTYHKNQLLRSLPLLRYRVVTLCLSFLKITLKTFKVKGATFIDALTDIVQFAMTPYGFPQFYYTRYIEYALGYSLVAPGLNDRVLDLGCGDSLFPLFLSFKDRPVKAIDYDRKVILKMRERAKYPCNKENPLTYLEGDMTSLPFEKESFDIIYAISSIEHLPGDGDIEVMREAHRVLSKGGKLFLSFECGDGDADEWIYHSVNSGREYFPDNKDSKDIPLDKTWLFCRRYNYEMICKRLLESGDWDLLQSGTFPPLLRPFYELENKKRNQMMGFLFPLFAILHMIFERRNNLDVGSYKVGSFAYLLLEKK